MQPTRLADDTYAAIVAMIEDEGMRVGHRLPAETQLAETIGVSRSVVREALARLASDGVTESRRGAGSFVVRLPSQLLKRHVDGASLSGTLGTYEVRFVLEAEAARLAAIRRSGPQVEVIVHRLDELRRALRSSQPADGEDMELHRAIMAATGNGSFVEAFNALEPDIGRVMKAGVDISRSRPSHVIDAMIDEHEHIVEAIRHSDPERAALAMRWHLSQGRRRLMP
ncbi:FadR/GntR family transcriptional regulator [Sphingomonas silueang]|uniref:FadR/GntR family transcriptional regulator n=1 Tax=Sphingomonas silueang TaxID=3156617 RepID=UPI0032B3C810